MAYVSQTNPAAACYSFAALLVAAITLSAMWDSFVSYPVGVQIWDQELQQGSSYTRAKVALLHDSTSSSGECPS